MLDHIGLAVADMERSRAFYLATLRAIGLELLGEERNALGNTVLLFGPPDGDPEFVIADGERPGEGNHVAFRVASREAVDAFHAAGLAAGGVDNGAPGLRPQYGDGYHAAFLIDPDGFNVEAVCRP